MLDHKVAAVWSHGRATAFRIAAPRLLETGTQTFFNTQGRKLIEPELDVSGEGETCVRKCTLRRAECRPSPVRCGQALHQVTPGRSNCHGLARQGLFQCQQPIRVGTV